MHTARHLENTLHSGQGQNVLCMILITNAFTKVKLKAKIHLRLLITFLGAVCKIFRTCAIFGGTMDNYVSMERLWNEESKYIYVIYRAGGPYEKKTVPEVLSTTQGWRLRAVLKTKDTVFSHTDRPSLVNNIFIFFLDFFFLKLGKKFYRCHLVQSFFLRIVKFTFTVSTLIQIHFH